MISDMRACSYQAIGGKIISALEGQGTGVQFNNIFSQIAIGDNYTFGVALGMLLLDSVLYMLLAWSVLCLDSLTFSLL